AGFCPGEATANSEIATEAQRAKLFMRPTLREAVRNELRLLGDRETLASLQPARARAGEAIQALDAVDRRRELGGDAPEGIAGLDDVDGLLDAGGPLLV